MLISIDGIDGCGKSTQVARLAHVLGGETLQEISPSRWGRQLRAMESPTLPEQLALFTADRAVISERLEAASGSETDHLVTDRSYLSGVAYQSFQSPLTPEFVEEMNQALLPDYDLQIYLHVPVETAFQRIDARGEERTWCENPELLSWATGVFSRFAETRAHVSQIHGVGTMDEVSSAILVEVEKVSTDRFGRVVWGG